MAKSADLILLFKAESDMSELGDVERALLDIERRMGAFGAAAAPVATALAAATAAVAALGVAGAKAAFEIGQSFDTAFDRIRVGTGQTGAALTQLQEDFRAVIGTVPTDFERAGLAITELARRTDLVGEPLQQLAGQMLELSRLTGEDLGQTLRGSTRLFGDWGVSIDQQSAVLDKLFAASQRGGGAVTDLQSRIVQFGAPMRQLGISLDESIALFTRWEREGVNVETVAGTMRLALQNLAQAGLSPREAFADLVATIRDMPNELEATQLAMQVFGARGGADMAAAIREGRFAVEELVAELEDSEGAIADAAEATIDGAERMTRAWNLVLLALEPLGTAVFDLAGQITEQLTPAVATLAGEVGKFVRDPAAAYAEWTGLQAGATTQLASDIVRLGQAFSDLGTTVTTLTGGFDPLLRKFAALGAAAAGLRQLQADLRLAAEGPAPAPFIGPVEDVRQSAERASAAFREGARDTLPLVQAQAEELADAAGDAMEEAGETAGEAARRAGRLAGGQFNQGLVDALAALRGGAGGAREAVGRVGRELAERAETIPESLLDGLVRGFAANRADLNALVGDIAGGAAVALDTALREGTGAAGANLAREIENLIDQARRAGVEGWRGAGDELAAAVHDALAAGTEAARIEALAAIAEFGTLITAAREQARLAQEEAKAAVREAERIARGLSQLARLQQQAAERLAAIEARASESRLAAVIAAAERSIAIAPAALAGLSAEQQAGVAEAQRVADDALRRREAMAARQRAQLEAIKAAFPEDTAAQDRDRQRAQAAAAEAVREARFRGNSLEILRAMRSEQEALTRAQEQQRGDETRLAREQALTAARARQSEETAQLERALAAEKLTRDLAAIDARAAAERTATSERARAEEEALRRELGLWEEMRGAADTAFDGALADLERMVDVTEGITEALRLPGAGGGAAVAPTGAGGGAPELNVTFNNYGDLGGEDPAELINAITSAGLSYLAAQSV